MVSDCETPFFTLLVAETIKAGRKTPDTNLPFDICLKQNVQKSQNTEKYNIYLSWIIVPMTCTNITSPVTKVETPLMAAPTQISKELLTAKTSLLVLTGCPPCALLFTGHCP